MQIFSTDTGEKQKIEKIINLGLGVMLPSNPSTGFKRSYHSKVPLALDNGAFSAWQKGYGFDEYNFLRCLHKCISNKLELGFIVCPDIVGGGLRSLEFSLDWELRLSGHPLYLAVQDGMTSTDILPHVSRFKGLFVGGTMDWKIKTGSGWVEFAHTHNKPCHIGRIGTVSRLRWARDIGADSVDSTSWVRNNTFHIIEEYLSQRQGGLFV